MLQCKTSNLVANPCGDAESCRKAGIKPAKVLKDCAFCVIPVRSSGPLMTDSVESALRNCNAALQNSSMQALFGRSFRNPWGVKRRGNRSQTFGTASGNFRRNCPNRGQVLAGFFGGISNDAGRYPQLPQARRGSHRRVHRPRREHFDARGGGFDPALLTSRPD